MCVSDLRLSTPDSTPRVSTRRQAPLSERGSASQSSATTAITAALPSAERATMTGIGVPECDRFDEETDGSVPATFPGFTVGPGLGVVGTAVGAVTADWPRWIG